MKQRHHRKVQMTQTNSTILWNYVLLWTITPHQVNPLPLQEAVSHSCSDTKSSGVEVNVCVSTSDFHQPPHAQCPLRWTGIWKPFLTI